MAKKRSRTPARPGSDAAYEVGYGRPPAHTQFKPGQSGNPSGKRKRPKEPPEPATVLHKTLARPVTMTLDGKPQQIPLVEAMCVKLGDAALKGNMKAAGLLITLLARYPRPLAGGGGSIVERGAEVRRKIEAMALRYEEDLRDAAEANDPKPKAEEG